MEYDLHHIIAAFLVRTVTGILFFFQGYDKIFVVKLKNVESTFSQPIKNTVVPGFLLRPSIIISSYIELICGFLLFAGLFKEPCMYLLSANMILVAFAFSSINAMWDMQHFFPRIIFLLFLLLIPPSWDLWALDRLF